MGRPPGAKNKMTLEHVAAAKDLAAEFGDPLRDLYIKRSRHEAIYAAEMAKSSRHRNTKKLAEAEEKILRYNEAILPFDRPKFQAINHSGDAAVAPMVIRAPATVQDSNAWLEQHRPKHLAAPAPELRIVKNVRSALATAEQLGGDIGAAEIFAEAAKATKNEDKA
jgi:hypothetical protein